MINKKIILSIFLLILTSACTTPTAMLGPAYTFTSTGNVLQTSLTYSSNEIITQYTGKSTLENVIELGTLKEKNVQTKTLESEEFYMLVKNKIEKTNKILNLSN
tara:strand:- start:1347 stop:1658 length:312 start_codon:yes stop_codon:yes gene_type:complete